MLLKIDDDTSKGIIIGIGVSVVAGVISLVIFQRYFENAIAAAIAKYQTEQCQQLSEPQSSVSSLLYRIEKLSNKIDTLVESKQKIRKVVSMKSMSNATKNMITGVKQTRAQYYGML